MRRAAAAAAAAEEAGDGGREGSKKRTRETQAAEYDEADDKKNRGNYRCSRCNLPKKGHVCPYQPRIKRKDLPADALRDASIQVEMDKDMVVRLLPLDRQGLPESYMAVKNMINQSLVSGSGGSSSSSSSSRSSRK